MRLRLPFMVAACTLSLLLGACASTDGLKPQAHMLHAGSLAAGQSLAGTRLSAAAWPTRAWWRSFGDPQLDALIAEALKHNPDVAIASARARVAEANARLVDAGRKPTVTGAAGLSAAHLPETVLPPPIGGGFGWSKDLYLKFHWDLDLWGGNRAAWEAAVDKAHASVVDTRAARLMLSVNVAQSYAALGYAFRRQALAEEELKRASSARGLTQQRVDAGIDSALQVKRADAEVATAQQQLAAAGRQVDAARVALSVLLGQGPDRGLAITRPRPLTLAPLAIPPNLPANLLGRRPDLVAARWRVEAARRGIKVAKTRFLPDISLGALAGLVAQGSTPLFQLPARFFEVGPALSLPVFEGGRLRANLATRDAQYDLAVSMYNKTLIGAINQVADALQGLHSLAVQIDAQKQALDAARDAWKLSEQRYKAGIGSFLEALGVRQQLLQAEQTEAALHAQQVDLAIQLIQSLGGGFHVDADKTFAGADNDAAPQSNGQ